MDGPDSGRDDAYDLLIAGGGILGAACAREAALDGRSVCLVEAGDLGGATSSASSKLVHGGLRYLEHGDFTLVREAVLERRDLLRTAAHLVEPLDFLLPVVPENRWPRAACKAAMAAYDLLAWPRGIGRHRWLPAPEVLAQWPGLRAEGLGGGYVYRDARMDDARLVLENVLDARDAGAIILPRTRLARLRPGPSGATSDSGAAGGTAGGRLIEAEIETASGRRTVRARQTLLCLGPWTDAFLGQQGLGRGPLLSPSRGDHLLVADWGLRMAAILPEPDSRRFFFVIPWGGHVLLGTTEHPWSPDEGDPVPHEADRAEILAWARRYFPGQELRPHAAFSGVRPLARDPAKPLEAVSRLHALVAVAPGIHALVGGKYTTFRAIAASCRGVWNGSGPSRTPGRLFPGAWSGPGEESAAFGELVAAGIPAATARAWTRRWGRRSAYLPEALADARRAGLAEGDALRGAEILFAARTEWAGTLSDVLVRRTGRFYAPSGGREAYAAARGLCAAGALAWDAEVEIAAHEAWLARTGHA